MRKGMFTLLVAALLLSPPPIAAQDEAPAPVMPDLTLQEMTAQADFVALVQVLDTDYEYTRKFPSGGTAFLRVLIPYKLDLPRPDIIEVYEEGLEKPSCYFPNPSPVEEGRRFLGFFRHNPDVSGQFLGLAQGCALEVLVTEDNSYALRFPLKGVKVADEITSLARATTYRDPYSILDFESLDVAERKALMSSGYLRRREDGMFVITHGVPWTEVRGLLGPENLTMDRALLRPVTPSQ